MFLAKKDYFLRTKLLSS